MKKTKNLILIIYDIENTRKRNKLVKLLNGYGYRVQKSAFEAVLTDKKYKMLIYELSRFEIDKALNESIRIYEISREEHIISFGKDPDFKYKEVIIV